MTARMMQTHFLLFGLVLLLCSVGLFGYLYSLEFERIDVSSGLRITRAGGIYERDFQLQVLGALVLLGLSVMQFQASRLLAQRRRSGLWLGRLSAFILLGGLPVGVLLWLLPGLVDTDDGGLIAQVIDELSLAVRFVAGVLVFQGLLALWYMLASFLRPMRRYCRMHTVLSNPLLRRVQLLGVLVWVLMLGGLAVTLGVMTDWLYELPVADPEPNELLYATTFDRFNDEWDLYPGRDSAQIRQASELAGLHDLEPTAALSGDVLTINYGAGVSDEVIWSVLNRKFSDFDLRVSARLLDGPFDQNQFGVIFRYRDPDNFYVFRITADGYYSLVKVRDGVQEKISDWGLTDVIRLGNASNEVRIVAVNDSFYFFINDTLMPLCMKGANETSMWANWEGPGICFTDDLRFVYKDGSFQQGRIALAAGTIDGSSVTVAFDDLVIVGPDPETSVLANAADDSVDTVTDDIEEDIEAE